MDRELVRLLVIEDDPAFAKLVATTLAVSTSARFETERSADLKGGLELLKKGSFDLVLLDLDLPDSKGVDTLRSAIAAAPQIPFVVMTGHDDEQTALEAMRHGAEDYLMKGPVDEATLVRAVRYALRRHRNVVDLRHFAQELMTNVDRFMSIVERARIGAVVTSPEGQVLYHNEAAVRLLERPAPELRTTAFTLPAKSGESLHLDAATLGPARDDAPCVEVQLAETEWDDRPARLHLVYPCHHGLESDDERLAAAAHADGGEDLTAIISDNTMEAVLVVDTDGTVRAASPAAARIFGTPRLTGANLWELLPGEADGFRDAFLSALEHGTETTVRHDIRGPDGQTQTARTALRPRIDPVIGIAKGMVCVVHPATQEAPAPARTEDDAPLHLLAATADSLRTALDAMRTQMHMLGSGEIGGMNAAQHKSVAAMDTELARLEARLLDILTLLRDRATRTHATAQKE